MLRSFLTRLIVITIILAAIVAVVNYLVPFFGSFGLFTWSALGYFFLLTILTGFIGFRSLEKSPHGFVASVNGIVMIKLFLCVSLVITYVLLAKPESPVFIVSFFILYIIYTVFEIRELIIAQKKAAPRK